MSVTINGSNTPTAGGVTYGDGTAYATTTAGTSGQALLSGGAGAPTWGTPASSTTATNLAGGSAGTVPYQSASGTTAMLAAGTSGQVLTSSGAGAPTWATPSAGAMTLISTQTASASATLAWTGLSGYARYLIVLSNIAPATANANLRLQFGTGAGPTYVTSGYDYGFIRTDNSGVGASNVFGSTQWNLTNSNFAPASASPAGLTGTVYVTGANGGYPSMLVSTAWYNAADNIQMALNGGGLTNSIATVTALKLFFSSGNITSGRC